MASLKSVPRNKLESDAAELQKLCADLEADVNIIKEQLKSPLEKLGKAKQSLNEINNELNARRIRDAQVPTVSEHAVLRYIERVHGVDIEAIKQSIMTDTVISAIKAGAAAVKTDECIFNIRDMTITTVIVDDRKQKPKKLSRARMQLMEDE